MTSIEPPFSDMLRAIQTVLHEFGVDYFLVGAFARDVHLSPSPSFAASRKTKDVDLAILLANEDQFHMIKDALVKTGAFEEISRNPIKLIYDRRIEVDLLPFGEIESEEHLINHYFDLNFEDIYTKFPDVFSLYDTDELTYLSLVSARIIGRKLGLLLRDRSGMQNRILAILSKRQTETWQAMRLGLLD